MKKVDILRKLLRIACDLELASGIVVYNSMQVQRNPNLSPAQELRDINNRRRRVVSLI
jgi:hypothetical protein